jgi:streptogramin lyase
MAAVVAVVFVTRSGDPKTVDRPADTALRLDAETGNLIPTATGTLGIIRAVHLRIAVGEGGVWVYDHVGARILHLDPRTGAVEKSVKVPSGAFGGIPNVAVGAQAVWVTSAIALDGVERGALVRIDPATTRLLPTLRFPGAGQATGVAVVPGSVWGRSRTGA